VKLECLVKYSHSEQMPVQKVIIWLHGLGADYNDFVPLIKELDLQQNTKFIFPNAPLRPITVNNGYVMRGWYDIFLLNEDIDATADVEGINKSVATIHQIIDQEIVAGVAAKNIIIAGFSQGGVISYIAGIKYKQLLGGIIALSTYIPVYDKFIGSTTSTIPIFAAHGTNDMVIPIKIGMLAYNKLVSCGFNITWKQYAMEHSVCIEEILHLKTWLGKL
jgi:phospholipase/carboxylesterase